MYLGIKLAHLHFYHNKPPLDTLVRGGLINNDECYTLFFEIK